MKPTPARPELEALAGQDYGRAIPLLEERAAARPADLEAQLELGLAHMLAGDEAQFAAIHQRVAAKLSATRPPKGRLARLWELSLSYFKRLLQAAAVVALLSGAGCESCADGGGSFPKYAVSRSAPEYIAQRPSRVDSLRPVAIPDGGTSDAAAPVVGQDAERPPRSRPLSAPRYAVRAPPDGRGGRPPAKPRRGKRR